MPARAEATPGSPLNQNDDAFTDAAFARFGILGMQDPAKELPPESGRDFAKRLTRTQVLREHTAKLRRKWKLPG